VEAVREFGADLLVVSAGLDTFIGDQVGGFCLETQSYGRIGASLAKLQLPTLLVQEGGYSLAGLGACIEALLQPFIDRRGGSLRADSVIHVAIASGSSRAASERTAGVQAAGKQSRQQPQTREPSRRRYV
jgi:acetoin utilization deacetylase AcuC-like enzyme